MKRSLFMSLIIAALAIAMALPLYAAGKAAPAGDIPVQGPEGMKTTKPVVKFSHKQHTADKCVDCHHKKAGNNDNAKCNTKGCHDNGTAKTGANSFYAAFHSNNPRSCVGCHKAKKATNPKAPTACNQCHV
ncbi:MAG: cytochrome c3 family protein [Humidesulfovibrio sp.]|nr:cytochrome c3 family protein [Humidesulfovibrio sp.]